MTYQDCRAYLASYQAFGSQYGLASVQALLDALGRPDEDLAIVHVAGTNGKGSTIAFLSQILQAGGVKVSSYTSPEVVHYRDRFQVDHVPVSEASFAKLCRQVADAADRPDFAGPRHPTVFEMELAIGLLVAQDAHADVFLLETGLGGRLDATNAVRRPALILMTPVAMDHTDLLGSDLTAIAQEKAGIFKAGVPILSSPQAPEVAAVFEAQAQAVQAPFRMLEAADIGYQDGALVTSAETYPLSLLGRHQATNAALAVAAARHLLAGRPNLEDAIFQGLATASWPGRLETISDRPRIYLDGAHNPQGARALADYLQEAHPDQAIHGLVHFFKDKDSQGILEATVPLLASLTYVDMGMARSLPADDAQALITPLDPDLPFRPSASLKAAFGALLPRLRPEDVLVVYGSLSHLPRARQLLRRIQKEGFS